MSTLLGVIEHTSTYQPQKQSGNVIRAPRVCYSGWVRHQIGASIWTYKKKLSKRDNMCSNCAMLCTGVMGRISFITHVGSAYTLNHVMRLSLWWPGTTVVHGVIRLPVDPAPVSGPLSARRLRMCWALKYCWSQWDSSISRWSVHVGALLDWGFPDHTVTVFTWCLKNKMGGI